MSARLLPDGIYNILNVKYSGFAVDLINGNPLGTVSGFTFDTYSAEQKWKLKNLCHDHVTLESMAAPRFYASSYIQFQGVALTGSPNATIWIFRPLGGQQYQITTMDAKYQWVLPADKDCATILLQDAKGAPERDAQWTLKSLSL